MKQHDFSNSNIQLKRAENFEQFRNMVADANMQGGIVLYPGTLYRQGGRSCFVTAFSLGELSTLTTVNRPTVGKHTVNHSSVTDCTNRPLDPKHKNAISNYLVSSSDYILPDIALNCDQPVEVISVGDGDSARSAMLLLPRQAKLEITDGQHRVEGVKSALESNPKLSGDAIGAFITFTGDHGRIHQDFADCAKTKAISASLLVSYDRRNPANGLSIDLSSKCPLFQYTVDSVKSSISAKSVAVWTTNQIRVMLKWALIGSQSSDAVFESNAKKILSGPDTDEYKSFVNALVKALDIMTQNNVTLSKIASVTPDTLSDIPKIKESENSMLLSGSGLAVFGLLWNKVRTEKINNPAMDTDNIIRRIAKVDWSNNSAHFRDNLKKNPERTQSGQKYVKEAGESIWRAVNH